MKHSGKRILLALIFLLVAAQVLMASTTVSDTDKYSWGPNIGWLNWQGDKTHGVEFNNSDFLSGYIWSANCGWINLGDGSPANGTAYANDSADDFGVNISGEDGGFYYLSGYAWSPNLGWLNVDADLDFGVRFGAPVRPVIVKSSGILQGYIWSANAGWLPLKSDTVSAVDLSGQPIPVVTGWMLH